jgi:hypothetical protein
MHGKEAVVNRIEPSPKLCFDARNGFVIDKALFEPAFLRVYVPNIENVPTTARLS